MMIGRDGEKHVDSCNGDCSCSDKFPMTHEDSCDGYSCDGCRERQVEETFQKPIVLNGRWLTIGDAPSFMISEKDARWLRETVDIIERATVGGAGGTGGGMNTPHYPHHVKDSSPL